MDEKPADAFRDEGRQLARRAPCRAVADGEADAVVSAGNTGAMLAAGLVVAPAHPRRAASRDRRPDPGAARPVGPDRRRRERRLPRPSTSCSSRRWAPSSPRRSSASPARPCGCSRSARSRRRETSSRSRRTTLLAASRPRLPRQRRGPRHPRGRRRRPRHRRLHGQRHAEGGRGDDQDAARRRCARRSPPRRAATLGGLLIRPAARRLRKRLDPDTYGGAYLLGLRGPRRDRARQLVADRDRERDPPRRPRRRARRRRPRSLHGCREQAEVV